MTDESAYEIAPQSTTRIHILHYHAGTTPYESYRVVEVSILRGIFMILQVICGERFKSKSTSPNALSYVESWPSFVLFQSGVVLPPARST